MRLYDPLPPPLTLLVLENLQVPNLSDVFEGWGGVGGGWLSTHDAFIHFWIHFHTLSDTLHTLLYTSIHS